MEQIYAGYASKIPSLTLTPHEMVEEVDSKTVVAMWTILKQHHEAIMAVLEPYMTARSWMGDAFDDVLDQIEHINKKLEG